MNMDNGQLLAVKLNLLKILFLEDMKDIHGNLIDNELYNYHSRKHANSRAFYIAHYYFTHERMPTVNDFRYINKTFNKLIKLISNDCNAYTHIPYNIRFKSIINYLNSKGFNPDKDWVDAYNKLIKLCE